MNISGTLNAFRLLVKPSLCIPQTTVATFDHVPIPVHKAFMAGNGGIAPDIKAVVLDKDNCFAKPFENFIYKPYTKHFHNLRQAYPGSSLLIVSNSAGADTDTEGREARQLEEATGVKVLRHSVKKPGCGMDIFHYLKANLSEDLRSPKQIAVIGDRLFTDVLMANMMGSYSIWVKDGVIRNDGILSQFEKALPTLLTQTGFRNRYDSD